MGVDEDQPLAAADIQRQLRHQLPDEDGVGVPGAVVQPGFLRIERFQSQLPAQQVDDVKGNPVIPTVQVAIADDQSLWHRVAPPTKRKILNSNFTP